MAMTFWQRMTAPSVSAAVAENLEQSQMSHSVARDRDQQNRLAADLMAKSSDAAVACPERELIQPSQHADVLDEYEALATAVGFNPPIVRRERIRCLLAGMGLYIYERAKVEAFLTSKFGEEKRTEIGTSATWCWRPMREVDRITASSVSVPVSSVSVDDNNGITVIPFPGYSTVPYTRVSLDAHYGVQMLSVNGTKALTGETYGKPVPIPVLRTIQRVLEIEPKARFFVSDETSLAERFRDPFLAVQLPGGDELHVIERWDEPSFIGREC